MPLSTAVSCQDFNLGPHPYRAHSRDAFKLGAWQLASSPMAWS
jgi:hypothetical protein